MGRDKGGVCVLFTKYTLLHDWEGGKNKVGSKKGTIC